MAVRSGSPRQMAAAPARIAPVRFEVGLAPVSNRTIFEAPAALKAKPPPAWAGVRGVGSKLDAGFEVAVWVQPMPGARAGVANAGSSAGHHDGCKENHRV